MRPDWHLRLTLDGRTGVKKVTLVNEEDAPGMELNGGYLAGLSAVLAATHTF